MCSWVGRVGHDGMVGVSGRERLDFVQTPPCRTEGSRQQRFTVLATPPSYVLSTSLNAAGHPTW